MDTSIDNGKYLMSLLNNRYHLQSIIGQGGMGRVYLAKDMTNEQFVAIKECFVAKDKDEKNLIERIKREYYFMTRINHPNLVKGIDFFYIQNKYYIVMEYVNGIMLKTFICEKKNSISLKKQLKIATQICSAIATLHQNNIIHRDLKPHNIMLSFDSCTPKLLDLGIAKMIHPNVETITKMGSIIGTPDYMSPEQFDCKVFYSSDVFSLGIILYQFFSWTECSPFASGNLISTMDKVAHLELPPLHTIYKGKITLEKSTYLLHISQVLERALHKNPQERFSSMTDFKNALNAFPKTQKIKRKQQSHKGKHSLIILIVCLFALSIALFVPNSLFFPDKLSFDKKNIATNSETNKMDIIPIIPNKPDATHDKSEEREIKLYYKKAHEYYQLENYEKALEIYNQIVAINAKEPTAYIKTGEIYHKTRNYQKALESYTQDIVLALNKAEIYYNIGNIYCDLGNHHKVIEYFSKALELDPNNIELHDHRSEHYTKLEEYEKAIEDCSIVIEKQPENIGSYWRRCYSYIELEEYNKAKKDLNKILKIEPENAQAYYEKGLILYYQERYDVSIENYNKAISLNLINDEIYYERGNSYCQLGENEKAIEDFTMAIKINPDNSSAYSHRGEHHMHMKEFEKSVADCSRALELDNEDVRAYGVRGLCYGYTNEYEKALADYNNVIKLEPAYDSAYITRGRAYSSLGNYQEAINDWNRAMELNSYNEETVRELINKAQTLLIGK